jgi:hypothetical protein
MRKPGDVLMIFEDPMQLKGPKGQARLLRFIKEASPICEEWIVEYLDDEEQQYTALVRKEES